MPTNILIVWKLEFRDKDGGSENSLFSVNPERIEEKKPTLITSLDKTKLNNINIILFVALPVLGEKNIRK